MKKKPNYREEMLKLSKTAKHSELLEQRLVYESVIQWQPQYKSQNPWVPYFWQLYVKRERGESGPDSVTFKVNDNDLMLFPELRKKKVIRLASANGKVYEVK